MTDFNEFDNHGSIPQKQSGSIISHAFDLYKGTLLYVVAAIVLSFIVSMIVSSVAGINMQLMLEDLKNGNRSGIFAVPGMGMYYGLSGLASLLLSPLYVGLIFIFNKFNNKEGIEFGDLFIGYKQNFVNILVYSLISSIIITISFGLCLLPGFFVAPFLMLGFPILLFENASFGEALSKSFKIASENYGVFLGATVLGILISISGIILCFIGILLTAYFYLAVMYSLYVAYQGNPRPVVDKA